jgi:hypothetical protein
MSTIRYSTFPRTEPPTEFVAPIVQLFTDHAPSISTLGREKGLTSDAVLSKLRSDLQAMGFDVEQGKAAAGKIKRPVFFGENEVPALQYWPAPIRWPGVDLMHCRPKRDGWCCR